MAVEIFLIAASLNSPGLVVRFSSLPTEIPARKQIIKVPYWPGLFFSLLLPE